jgi:alpha-glucosidase
MRDLWSFSVLESGPERIRVAFAGFGTASFEVKEGRLHLRFEDLLSLPEGGLPNRLSLRLAAGSGEHVYGCGEQFSFLDLKGRLVPLWCEEQGVGRGPNLMKVAADLAEGAGGTRFSTYFPMTAFLSSEGWSCLCRTGAWASFDFRRARETSLNFWEVPEELVFDAAPTMCDLVGRLSAFLGRQPPPPAWAFEGLILGAQGGTAEVLSKLKALKDAGAPVKGLWAQDWCGRRVTSFGKQLMWNWEADPALYPGLKETIAELKAGGVRFLGYINPFLATGGRLHSEATEKGLFVKAQDGSDYIVPGTFFPVSLLDLSNPAAFEWIKSVIKAEMIGQGLSGWMADFGEYLPTDAVLHAGEDAELAHNHYPELWARANREAVAEAGMEGEVLYFLRSGYTASARYAPSFWAGDQLVNWCRDDGIPSVVPAALSLGLCGVPFWHSDLGGYTTVGWVRRSRELLLRWAELAAFTPIMRSHEGNRPESNVQPWADAGTAAAVARLARVHAALAPYVKALAAEYAKDGLPIMRPLFLHHPDDPRCANLPYQYLYGRDLLVAPVLRRGARSRRLYVPEGDWLDLWSGVRVTPGWRRVPAPLGRPPVLYRPESPWAQLFASLSRT